MRGTAIDADGKDLLGVSADASTAAAPHALPLPSEFIDPQADHVPGLEIDGRRAV